MRLKILLVSIVFLLPLSSFPQIAKRAVPFGVEIGADGSCDLLKTKIKTIDPSIKFITQIDVQNSYAGNFSPVEKVYPDAHSLTMVCLYGKIIHMTLAVKRDESNKNIFEAMKVLDAKYNFIMGSNEKDIIDGGSRFYHALQADITLDTKLTSNTQIKLFHITYEDMTDRNNYLLEKKREDLKSNSSRFKAL